MSSLWTFDLYWHTDTQKVRRYRSNINSDVFSIKHSIVIKSDIKTQGFMVLAKDHYLQGWFAITIHSALLPRPRCHHPTYRPDVAWRKAAMGRRSIPHTVCAPSVKQTSAMAWSNDEITWWLWENIRHIQISGPASLLRWTNLGNIKLVSLSGNHGWIHVTCYVLSCWLWSPRRDTVILQWQVGVKDQQERLPERKCNILAPQSMALKMILILVFWSQVQTGASVSFELFLYWTGALSAPSVSFHGSSEMGYLSFISKRTNI